MKVPETGVFGPFWGGVDAHDDILGSLSGSDERIDGMLGDCPFQRFFGDGGRMWWLMQEACDKGFCSLGTFDLRFGEPSVNFMLRESYDMLWRRIFDRRSSHLFCGGEVVQGMVVLRERSQSRG